MSSYEGEEGADVSLSRKSSNTSSTSSSSSSKDDKMKQYMKQMEEELAGTKIADAVAPAANTSSSEDEFGDVEDFCPVKVDLKAVQDLVKTYSAQNGVPGPASSLLGSVGMKPKNT